MFIRRTAAAVDCGTIPMNIAKLLTRSATSFPARPAIIHGRRQIDYGTFEARTGRLAAALRRLGIGAGDNVSVLMYNRPEMLEAMFASFKLGCAAVPLNFRLHPNEVAYIVDNSESRALIMSPEFVEPMTAVRERFPAARHLIAVGAGDQPKGLLDYEQLLDAEPDALDDADVAPDDVAWIFYTSGTTGAPKGAMLTHRNLLAMTMNYYADICPGFGFDEVVLHAAPLSHGSGCYALPNIGKAAANVIPASVSFDAGAVLQAIEAHRVTNMFVAPTMVRMLMDAPDFERYDLSSMKALCYGGAPMMVEDLAEAMAKFGGCLVQLYGQAEAPMTISYLPHQEHVPDTSPEQTRRLASAGIARTDCEVVILDRDDRELPPDEMGEIATRSDLVMKGYWRNPEATAETLRGGWLHTGDMGYLDDRGYLFIMDRSKDMIISGGENIYPREIEEVIIQHAAVREVAVVGIPDPVWGEAVIAIVSLVPGGAVEEAELIELCRSQIASYKKPRRVEFVDELPVNNYGKILKRELRDRYWKDTERKV